MHLAATTGAALNGGPFVLSAGIGQPCIGCACTRRVAEAEHLVQQRVRVYPQPVKGTVPVRQALQQGIPVHSREPQPAKPLSLGPAGKFMTRCLCHFLFMLLQHGH